MPAPSRTDVTRTPPLGPRLTAIALWPFGISLTSWHYMWRTTPMHRSESPGSAADLPPPLPDGLLAAGLQRVEDGVGPLYHRRYSARIREARTSAEALVARLAADPNAAAPTEFARFRKLKGAPGTLCQNDELLVHMPGPWNGPVRVAEAGPLSFRLATLEGHLEAGQISFSAADDGGAVCFAIESWARSGDRVSNVLYNHLRMAKEVQLHMWSSFLEQVAKLAGGRLDGGIEIRTYRLEDPGAAA